MISFIAPCTNVFSTQVTYPASSKTYCVTAVDLNGDGYSDIIVANYNANNTGVFINRGNGTFFDQVTYSTGSNPMSVAAADVNGDGYNDIIIANSNSNNVGVLLNNGSGTFTAQVTYSTGSSSAPYYAVVGDVNGDGHIDIVVVNNILNNVGVLLNNDNGTFASEVTYSTGSGSSPFALTLDDVNGDVNLDIIVANFGTNKVGVFLNKGNGTFATQLTYPSSSFPCSVSVADVNGDGYRDIIVANQGTNTMGVLRNVGNGTFAVEVTYSTGGSSTPNSVTTADVNGDSYIDVIVANPSGPNVGVFLNLGNGTFATQVTYTTGIGSSPYSVITADVNKDSKPDIIVANLNANNAGVFLNVCH